ncbi:MAG: sensor domain-containing diguanylate cyclase [Nitrospirae bacterium]|nr:sensor domain-containing diguanylate cyclase [Nitrospirota bacterium]
MQNKDKDKTEEELIEELTRYKRLLEAVTDYIYTVRVENGRVVSTTHGPNCIRITGYSPEEYEENPLLWYQMIYEEDKNAVLEQASKVVSGKPAPFLEHRIIHKDGSIRWVRNTPVLRYNEHGQFIGYDGLISDITERKMIEEKLVELAEKDPLTNIYNRRKFYNFLEDEIERAKRYKRPLSLIMFDIDYFKKVNDMHGHNVGDRVLIMIADIVAANIRRIDVFGRLGGEEFGILVSDTAIEGSKALAEKVKGKIESHNFDVAGKVTISIGVTEYKDDDTSDSFLKRVDDALYMAKDKGRNRVEVV